MSLYSMLGSLKKLVDGCEEAIKEGKLAVSTRNMDLIVKFIGSVKAIATQAPLVLTEAKSFIEKCDKEDKLAKYISAYYRTLVLVSVPYLIMILRELADLLDGCGHENRVNEVRSIIASFESTLDTLK